MNAFDNIAVDPDQSLPSPAYSDDALARRMAQQFGQSLRYVAAWGRWLIWDGKVWQFDETLRAFDIARMICREAASEQNKPKAKAVLASAKTVAAIHTLAKADRRFAATVDQWDADPWLLNTPAGVLDLRIGKIRPHDHTDYITKVTSVAPRGRCPRWREFLAKVTNGDEDLQQFLQRVIGYGLTGITSEHALFFLHGTGANGKSVFLNTVSGIAADYARSAPIETFTASNTDRHPTDLAGLRGARLVTAVETEEGRRWAESRIKALTGGDKIAARFMRQDFFEYVPAFKLIIAGNHKPGLRTVDEAIRRRFHLIPFTVTIPEAERDPELGGRLKDEWPGILAWAVEGCLQWQEMGLQPPAIVREATAAYLQNEDAFAAWMDECCERCGWELTALLFANWKAWAERSGEPAGTLKRFREQLEARGFVPLRKHSGRGVDGLSLVQAENTDFYWKER